MAKTRLNERSRKVLCAHARSLVACPAEKKAADTAYASAAVLVRKMIETRYPPKDMAILKKYDQASSCHSIKIQFDVGGYEIWSLRKDEAAPAPLQPGHYSAVHIADRATTAAIQKSMAADKALKEALENKLADYYSLIAAANAFEDVCEVWPEAEAVRSQCGASAIVVAVTPEVVARIRQDVATRLRKAA